MSRQPPVPPFPAYPPFPPFPPYPSAGAMVVFCPPTPLPILPSPHVPPPPTVMAPPAAVVPPPNVVAPPPPVVLPPPQQGRFTVASIQLPPVPGAHSGTGRQSASGPVVEVGSVAGSGPLQFTDVNRSVTTLLFELRESGALAQVVPNWFGVAVPSRTVDFSNANVFFHPEPAQAGYKDSDYPTKAGLWPRLFYYMERLGYQLDASGRNQIIVMPFLTQARTDTGIFPDNWLDILTNILAVTRFALGRSGPPVSPATVTVSSYSVGIVYSDAFRKRAAGLSQHMAEVWDFDGLFSSASNLSRALHSTSAFTVRKYQQQDASMADSVFVPRPRWANAPAPPQSALDVHHLIRDFMFRHACNVSGIG